MARNYIVLDTETAPTFRHCDGQPHPETSLVYDVGWVVVDGNSGEFLETRSFLNTDVFFTQFMNSAYYAEKLPNYWDIIRDNVSEFDASNWYFDTFLNIFNQFKEDVREYEVRDIWAYNAKFDKTVLNHTIETLSNGYVRFFAPYGVKNTKVHWRDVWDYASCITGSEKFVKWAMAHEKLTASGNPKTSAECVYQYLTGDDGFVEEHTALSDAMIEAYILRKAKKRHKKTRHSMGQGWRDAAKTAKTMR